MVEHIHVPEDCVLRPLTGPRAPLVLLRQGDPLIRNLQDVEIGREDRPIALRCGAGLILFVFSEDGSGRFGPVVAEVDLQSGGPRLQNNWSHQFFAHSVKPRSGEAGPAASLLDLRGGLNDLLRGLKDSSTKPVADPSWSGFLTALKFLSDCQDPAERFSYISVRPSAVSPLRSTSWVWDPQPCSINVVGGGLNGRPDLMWSALSALVSEAQPRSAAHFVTRDLGKDADSWSWRIGNSNQLAMELKLPARAHLSAHRRLAVLKVRDAADPVEAFLKTARGLLQPKSSSPAGPGPGSMPETAHQP